MCSSFILELFYLKIVSLFKKLEINTQEMLNVVISTLY